MIAILKFIQVFLNSNIGVVTFIVGSLAIYLYVKQRIDHRRDAASLILQEIRYAEHQIRNAKEGANSAYPLASKLLPTNNWSDNIHLFVKDLKEIQIDMINSFYAKATFIDFLISKRADQKMSPSLMIQNTAPSAQGGSVTSQPTSQQQFQVLPHPGEPTTVQILTEVSNSIEFLYNTPTVEKLREISERKWYQIF